VLSGRPRMRLGGSSSEAWLRNALRGLLVASLGMLLLLGVRDVIRPFVAGAPVRPAPATTAGYPREAAEAFAGRFALAYLSFDSAHPDTRRLALQAYLAPGSDPELGWDGQGRQTAVAALPSGIAVLDGGQALIQVAVQVDGGRWVYLAVQVFADGDRLAVVGMPALLPPPGLADAQSSAAMADQDPKLSGQLRPYLAAFLRAYAQSNQTELAYYSAPGIQLAGLGGQVAFASLVSLSVEQSSGSSRTAVVGVRWHDQASGAGLTQRYRLRLVEAGGKWLVGDVSPDE
jgi:hypothetical protein